MARRPLNLPVQQRFPQITYRRGAAGIPTPEVSGTGVRVQTIVIAAVRWGQSHEKIATDYDLTLAQVEEALAFYAAHGAEIDRAIEAEQTLEAAQA